MLDLRSLQLYFTPPSGSGAEPTEPVLHEMRGLGSHRASIVTRDPAVLVTAASAPEFAPLNLYLVNNPLKYETLQIRGIREKVIYRPKFGQCASDIDVLERWLIFFDWDSKRPTGTAATKAQRALAAKKQAEVTRYLVSLGWPPARAELDSGNGRHSHWRTRLPNNAATNALLASLYSLLAAQFDTAEVKFDTSVQNAARLARLPGSFNFKANRACAMVSESLNAGLVTEEMIATVVDDLRRQLGRRAPAPSHASGLVVRMGTWSPELMEKFLDFYEIDYSLPVEIPSGTMFRLNPCPLNPLHTGSSPAVLVTKGGFPKFICKHDSCRMSWQQFRTRLRILTGKWFLTQGGK